MIAGVQVEVYSPPVPTRPIDQLSPAVQMTPHLVNIHDPHFHTFFNNPRVMAAFYSLFADDYDMLTIVAFPSRPGSNPWHEVLHSDAVGIGLGTPPPGAPRLKGLNSFPVSYLFDGATQVYTHAVGHQWIKWFGFTPFNHGMALWRRFCRNIGSQTLVNRVPAKHIGKHVDEGNRVKPPQPPQSLKFQSFQSSKVL